MNKNNSNNSYIINGHFITNFGDELKIIEPGEKYYGELIGNWASTTPDAKFIRSSLYHPYDYIYHISDKIREILDNAIEKEIESAQRRADK